MDINMQAIGFVQSCYIDKFGTPRQPGLVEKSRAFIKLEAFTQPEQSLLGIEGYSHLWVIFLFHKNTNARFHAKVHPPRLQGKSLGLFATRSPHRPNPIGLSLVKLESVEKDGVWVSGIDLVDGTPVLDIKPYVPNIEIKADATGGWTDTVSDPQFDFEWGEQAEQDLLSWSSALSKSSQEFLPSTIKTPQEIASYLRSLIEQTLGLDPRPTLYKEDSAGEAKYRQTHAVRIWDGDIHFSFKNNSLVILNIKKSL